MIKEIVRDIFFLGQRSEEATEQDLAVGRDLQDTLRANQYRDNLSLAEMAAISRMPMETFRKRFVAEVGMPPLSYVLHCKMERAKELLRDQNCSVRQAGAAVGMQDPYHFSTQFKNIVGISPSAFMKQAAVPNATIRGATKKEKKTK